MNICIDWHAATAIVAALTLVWSICQNNKLQKQNKELLDQNKKWQDINVELKKQNLEIYKSNREIARCNLASTTFNYLLITGVNITDRLEMAGVDYIQLAHDGNDNNKGAVYNLFVEVFGKSKCDIPIPKAHIELLHFYINDNKWLSINQDEISTPVTMTAHEDNYNHRYALNIEVINKEDSCLLEALNLDNAKIKLHIRIVYENVFGIKTQVCHVVELKKIEVKDIHGNYLVYFHTIEMQLDVENIGTAPENNGIDN